MSFRDTDWKGLDKGKDVSYILSKIKSLFYSIADVILKLLAMSESQQPSHFVFQKEVQLRYGMVFCTTQSFFYTIPIVHWDSGSKCGSVRLKITNPSHVTEPGTGAFRSIHFKRSMFPRVCIDKGLASISIRPGLCALDYSTTALNISSRPGDNDV